MTGREAEAAARLLERLLSDPSFREQFRRNPVAEARRAGLEAIAEEMAMAPGAALDTLDGRESRSSLAGVLMAAALEGAGVFDVAHDLAPHAHGLPEPVERVLAREHAPAARPHVAASSVAGEFRAVTPHRAAAAPLPEPLEPPAGAPAVADAPHEAADQSAVPGSLEDPGSETDAEADDESDGDGGDEEDGSDGEGEDGDDSDSDDPSDDEEDDENEGGEAPDADDGSSDGGQDDGGDNPDGDHDDDSDAAGGDGSRGESGDDDSGAGADSGSAGDVGDHLDTAPATYPGDDAPRPQIAAWMAGEAQKRGLPPELPVMAALVESGLRNAPGGDRDSVGFFQMRDGIWNQGEYAGYPDRPRLQLQWFIDHALAVKAQRIAAGKPTDDPHSYGEWIADVERPAAQYRGRYQLRLDQARELLRQGPAHHQEDVPVTEGAGGGADRPGAGPRAVAAVAEARRYIGTPYKWGGSTPKTGFDCSGLVQWAYAKAGIRLPRTSEEQILAPGGKPVSRADLRAGDLVFFRDASGDVHHVGISLGGDKFINAPHTGARVRINSLNEPYFAQQFTGGRRFDAAPAQRAAVETHAAGVDPREADRAEAALLRDAAEAQRPGTMLFQAVRAQELHKQRNLAMTLPAIDPDAIP